MTIEQSEIKTSLRAFFSILILLFAFDARAEGMVSYPIVKMRSLDKITARTQTFEAPVGSTVKFQFLKIKIQSCLKSSPMEKPESAAFLQIWETAPDDAHAASDDKDALQPSWVFSGWMFASSPGLSSMDHPIYDVWVLDCLGDAPQVSPEASDEDGEPAEGQDS